MSYTENQTSGEKSVANSQLVSAKILSRVKTVIILLRVEIVDGIPRREYNIESDYIGTKFFYEMPFISSSELKVCSRIKALYRKTLYLNNPFL